MGPGLVTTHEIYQFRGARVGVTTKKIITRLNLNNVRNMGHYLHNTVIPAKAGIYCPAGTDNTTTPSTTWTPLRQRRGFLHYDGRDKKLSLQT